MFWSILIPTDSQLSDDRGLRFLGLISQLPLGVCFSCRFSDFGVPSGSRRFSCFGCLSRRIVRCIDIVRRWTVSVRYPGLPLFDRARSLERPLLRLHRSLLLKLLAELNPFFFFECDRDRLIDLLFPRPRGPLVSLSSLFDRSNHLFDFNASPCFVSSPYALFAAPYESSSSLSSSYASLAFNLAPAPLCFVPFEGYRTNASELSASRRLLSYGDLKCARSGLLSRRHPSHCGNVALINLFKSSGSFIQSSIFLSTALLSCRCTAGDIVLLLNLTPSRMGLRTCSQLELLVGDGLAESVLCFLACIGASRLMCTLGGIIVLFLFLRFIIIPTRSQLSDDRGLRVWGFISQLPLGVCFSCNLSAFGLLSGSPRFSCFGCFSRLIVCFLDIVRRWMVSLRYSGFPLFEHVRSSERRLLRLHLSLFFKLLA